METHQSNGQLRTISNSSVPPTKHTRISINHYELFSLEQHYIVPAAKLDTASEVRWKNSVEGKEKTLISKAKYEDFLPLNF